METVNILIVHPCKGFYGGAEEVVSQLCNHLLKRHSVFLVTKDAPMELFDNNARHVRTKGFADFRRQVQSFVGWADVINAHNFPANLAVYPYKPVVWYCNEPPELFTNWKRKPIELFNRRWVEMSGMKVVVADSVNQSRFLNIYKVKPEIVPYGIDYEFWSKPCPKVNSGQFTILQVGHPELFDKGQQIYAEVKKENPNAKLVRLSGRGREAVRGWYRNADVLIHPIGSQGGWLVPFEAMCAGLPVVIAPQFTGARLIKDNNLGVVTDDIASAVLIHRWSDNGLAKTKEWVRKNLTWDRFGRSMERIFKEAMNA